MLAENAGLPEQLAALLKMPIDRIGFKGSAVTAVIHQFVKREVPTK